jgi:hypothetical protein
VTAARQTDTAVRPIVLFVLGMSRSGTSALTRVISLCGGALPPGMTGGFIGNRRGYWEPRKAAYVTDAILRRHHSAGYDPSLRLQEDGEFDTEEKGACISKIHAYLTELPTAPVTVIKYPQITLLSNMWFEAARRAGFDIMTVNAVRHPQEVIASFQQVGGRLNAGVSPELAGALWLKYNLLAEKQTRSMPRVFVEYANLLQDWHREVDRISTALGIILNTENGAVEEFLAQDLRHQHHSGPVAELFGLDWFSTVYEALGAAGRDESWNESSLDRVFEEYRVRERGFRMAFNDFERVYKINRHTPLSIGRAVGEVLAIAHGRKGTWA